MASFIEKCHNLAVISSAVINFFSLTRVKLIESASTGFASDGRIGDTEGFLRFLALLELSKVWKLVWFNLRCHWSIMIEREGFFRIVLEFLRPSLLQLEDSWDSCEMLWHSISKLSLTGAILLEVGMGSVRNRPERALRAGRLTTIAAH